MSRVTSSGSSTRSDIDVVVKCRKEGEVPCEYCGGTSLGWQAAQIALQDLGLEPDVSENVYGVMIRAPGFRFGRP